MMDRKSAEGYMPMVLAMMLGTTVDDLGLASTVVPMNHTSQQPSLAYARSNTRTPSSTKEKRIAVLPLKHAIIKYDEPCGNYGTETFSELIREANANADISAIVIDVDTPGGMGTACQNPVTAIRECGKPVIAYAGNGICASAGMYIVSECDEIYCEHGTDEIGSIGTYVTLADFYRHYREHWHLHVKDVYASKSSEKNRAFREALEKFEEDGSAERMIKEYIDPFNEAFIAQVKQGRGDRLTDDDQVFKGKLYWAKDALNIGLIDGMKSFNEVLQRAADLAA